MSDPVFAPAKKPAGAVAPGNAQLVYLREVLFSIKGVFFHPLKDADAPLPPHRWALVEPGEKIFVEGTTSDANGVSTIPRPDDLASGDNVDWDLWLIPMFEDKKSSSDVATYAEVWIDVDKNQWVRPSEMADTMRTETRRLLRIPRWSTWRHKAASKGTFRELLPGSAEFEKRGRIKASELAPHGTPDKPWTIAIDEGLMRTFVQFRFYDPVQKKERAVPTGLILEAYGVGKDLDGTEIGPSRAGASSVRRDDGSIYMLHDRPEAESTDLDYQFQTKAHTTFAYADGKFQSDELTDLARLEKEYPVAPLWHSYGQEAWEGAVDADASVRKSFISIRAKGTTAASPLCFHLDDLVLTSNLVPITVSADARRMGVYTTFAELLDPQQLNSAEVSYSKQQASTRLRAEKAAFIRGQGFDKMTRFIDHEGEIYEVSTKFAFGFAGTTAYVGGRAADLATPMEDNRTTRVRGNEERFGHRTYLLDTRWVHHTHDGVAGRLAHILNYVTVFIDKKELNPANSDAGDLLENLLVQSSNRWTQKHPGVPANASLKKDYAIVPESGFKTDSTILKVRYLFTSRSAEGNKLITVQVDTQPGRATGGDPTATPPVPMRLYCQTGPNMNVPHSADWLTQSPADPKKTIGGQIIPVRPYEFEPSSDGVEERLDKSKFKWFTFAHELGHKTGLLDEYLEPFNGRNNVSALATEFFPRFEQFGVRARPYYLDTYGMMQSNQLPRARYIWNFLDALHLEIARLPTTHWGWSEAPFVVKYVAGSRTLTHAVARDAASWLAKRGGPWTPTAGTQGLCNLSFYPTSQDEGTIGPHVLENGLVKAGEEFDGVLVIHPQIWVSFAADMSTNALDRWSRFAPWASTHYKHATVPHFAISTPDASDFKRTVIVFQPRFEFGPNPTSGETSANATFELRLRKAKGAPTFTSGSPGVLTCYEHDVGPWILRYALMTQPSGGVTPPGSAPVASKAATTAADLSMLPEALANLLGRSEHGTVVSYGAG